MKRGCVIIAKLLIFLLLGAVVNVGVAWRCAASSYGRAGLDPAGLIGSDTLYLE